MSKWTKSDILTVLGQFCNIDFFHGYDTNSHTCDGSYSEVGRNEPTGQGNCQKGEIITFLDPVSTSPYYRMRLCLDTVFM